MAAAVVVVLLTLSVIDTQKTVELIGNCSAAPCGQSYKSFMIVNYNSRVVPDLKIPHITTLEL